MDIYEKICDESILDSEIIECAKKDSRFDINWTNGGDYGNWTLLIWTVYHDRRELAEYLLADPDIDVNYKDNDGRTALYESCCLNDIYILKLLLGHKGINVNIQNRYGLTGLHWASCYNNYIEYVKEFLLDARVDVWIRDENGLSARDVAIQDGCRGIANILGRIGRTSLLRIPNALLCRDIVRKIIEEYM